jgi:hypothetical protein
MLKQVEPEFIAPTRWVAGFTGDISDTDRMEMVYWCVECFGVVRDDGPWTFTGLTTRYGYSHVCVYIVDLDDAFRFKLRWC